MQVFGPLSNGCYRLMSDYEVTLVNDNSKSSTSLPEYHLN